jgi:ribose 5-phosphate isomerase A
MVMVDMKKLAGEKAAEYVKDGMVLGLGTGSTAYHMVNAVGELVRKGYHLQAIPTSNATEKQARELGIPLLTIDEVDHIDLDIDGVDEIDPEFNAIKGGGGALYREKVVATLAKEVIWIMDESKLVDHIGAFHLPIEVAKYGSKQAFEKMDAYGWKPVMRERDGELFVTDNGNYIIDLHLGAGFDIQDVKEKVSGIVGVLEHGLFLNFCKRIIVGKSNGEVMIKENPNPAK